MDTEVVPARAEGVALALAASVPAVVLALLAWKIDQTGSGHDAIFGMIAVVLAATFVISVSSIPLLFIAHSIPSGLYSGALSILALDAIAVVAASFAPAIREGEWLSIILAIPSAWVAAILLRIMSRIVAIRRKNSRSGNDGPPG